MSMLEKELSDSGILGGTGVKPRFEMNRVDIARILNGEPTYAIFIYTLARYLTNGMSPKPNVLVRNVVVFEGTNSQNCLIISPDGNRNSNKSDELSRERPGEKRTCPSTSTERDSDFDALIRKFAVEVSKEAWSDADQTEDSDIRLDCYVDPQLSWVKHKRGDIFGGFQEMVENLREPREKQPWAVFQKIRQEGKNLLISDHAGAGKTILTRKIAQLVAEQAKPEGSDQPLMIFRFVKPLPLSKFESIEQLLLSDTTLKRLDLQNDESKRLIDFALKNRRVVIILDGLDEFAKHETQSFLGLLRENSGKLSHQFLSDPNQVTTIIAGRQHAIDEQLDKKVFEPKQFARIRIEPFSKELQDEYFYGKNSSEKNNPKRNPLAKTRFESNGWRDVLPMDDDTLDDVIGLPHTLIQIRQAIESCVEDKNQVELIRFVSQSHLFLYASNGLMMHALNVPKLEPNDHVEDSKESECFLLTKLLGIVAWRMTLAGYRRSVSPEKRKDIPAKIKEIKQATQDCCEKTEEITSEKFEKAWKLLERIALKHRGITDSFQADYLAFRNARIQELHVARFLTQHATAEDLVELRKKIGDEGWARILVLAAQMPLGMELGADKEVYANTLECIFSRPTDKTHRRPTEVMWRAVEFLKIPRQDDLDDFRADLVRSLKNQLADEFQRIKNGLADWITDPAEIVRAKLIAEGIFRKMPNDPRGVNPPKNESHMVVLADPRKPRKGKEAEDEEKVVDRNGKPMMEFQMGSPQVETDAFDDEKKVYVWLSLFAIHRFPVRNKEFQLFDPAQADEVEDRGAEFLGPDQPAVMVSWYDATVFTWFLGSFTYDDESDQREWRFALPTEAQWEYACRAGTTSLYGVCDQETDLKKYAWFSGNPKTVDQTHEVGLLEPNRWGLYDMLGNVWEWCLDGYDE